MFYNHWTCWIKWKWKQFDLEEIYSTTNCNYSHKNWQLHSKDRDKFYIFSFHFILFLYFLLFVTQQARTVGKITNFPPKNRPRFSPKQSNSKTFWYQSSDFTPHTPPQSWSPDFVILTLPGEKYPHNGQTSHEVIYQIIFGNCSSYGWGFDFGNWSYMMSE